MRFSWPAWLSLALGAAVAVGFSSGPSANSLTLRAAPSIVTADGGLVAAVVPGDRKGHCAQIVLWRPGDRAVTIKTVVQCDNDGAGLDGVDGLALGSQTVLWQETHFG